MESVESPDHFMNVRKLGKGWKWMIIFKGKIGTDSSTGIWKMEAIQVGIYWILFRELL